MTRVRIEREGDRYRLLARGHATGSQAVCAAVSGIVYALAGYVQNLPVQTGAWELERGRARLEVIGDRRVKAAFDMAAVGLGQIAAQYPQLVKLEHRNTILEKEKF